MECVRWRRWKLQSPGSLFGDALQDNVGGEAIPPAVPNCLELDWREFEIQGTFLHVPVAAVAPPVLESAIEERILPSPWLCPS